MDATELIARALVSMFTPSKASYRHDLLAGKTVVRLVLQGRRFLLTIEEE